MANQTYFCTLTAVGEAKDANAKALGTALKFTEMAVGDGNGALPVPDRNRTALVRQVRRAPINTLKADPLNPGQVIAEQIIPEDVGGWWIRELGLYDDAGDLVAIGNCPETYKPQLAEGSGRVQVVRMVLIMSSAATVQLKIDPAVVLATRKYADDQDTLARKYADDQDAAHVAAPDPHPQYMTDPETAAKIAAAIAGKADLAGAAFTGPVSFSGITPSLTVTTSSRTIGSEVGSLKFFSDGGTASRWAGVKGYIPAGSAGIDFTGLSFHTNNGADNNAPRMCIVSDGKVGIGTLTPAGLLHVNGRAILGTLGLSGQNALTLNPDLAGSSVWHLKSGGGAGYDGLAVLSGSDAYSNPTVRMYFNGSGSVGVGTVAPSERLHVVGGNIAVSPTSVQTGQKVGSLSFIGYTGYATPSAAGIESWVPSGLPGIDFQDLRFKTVNAQSNLDAGRFTYNGDFLVGTTSGTCHTLVKAVSQGVQVLNVNNTVGGFGVYGINGGGNSTAGAGLTIGKNDTTNRSINAGGTVNASGADYAEYMTKSQECGVIEAGQIAGINAAGLLVDTWADSVSFLIKSTNPSYVGGDGWGSGEALGMHRPDVPLLQASEYAGAPAPGEEPVAPIEPVKPSEPVKPEPPAVPPAPVAPEDATDDEKVAYAVLGIQYQAAIEAQAAAYQEEIDAQGAQYQADLERYATMMAVYQELLAKYEEDKAAYDRALAAYQADQAAYAEKVESERLYFDAITMPAYQAELAKFEQVLEAARQRVDRMAYCGQVPVNITGAKPGQYVVPVQDGDGIAGQLVDADAITFDQYRRAVGIVQNVLEDGRANVRVKPV